MGLVVIVTVAGLGDFERLSLILSTNPLFRT